MRWLEREREEDQWRRALHGALLQWRREKSETLTQYALRREQQCQTAADMGVLIPSAAKGFLMLEGAQLPPQGAQNLRTLCAGDWAEQIVAKALRTLDISMETSAKVYWEDGPPEEEPEDDDEEDKNFLAELEALDLEEEEAQEAFSALETQRRSWADNRRLKQNLKKDRAGAIAAGIPQGSRPAGSSFKKDRKKLTIAELKLISRCANCGQKGHWKAECTNAYRPKDAQKGNGGGAMGSHFAFAARQPTSASRDASCHTTWWSLASQEAQWLRIRVQEQRKT